MELSVILPAYREAENLKKILPKIREELKSGEVEFEILVIDTKEPTDDTREVCISNGVRYISRQGGNYYGDAIRTGIAEAIGGYVVVMDADGSHNPHDILRFMDEMKREPVDLIIGSRYCKGGYTDNNFILRFMSWMLNVSYRVVFGIKVKDISDSYRLYKADQVKKLDLKCDNFDIVEEIIIKLYYSKKGYRISEVPISFNKREFGESKRDLVKFIFSYIKTMSRLIKVVKESK